MKEKNKDIWDRDHLRQLIAICYKLFKYSSNASSPNIMIVAIGSILAKVFRSFFYPILTFTY